MSEFPAEVIVADSSFRDQAVNVWVPMERASKGVENTDHSRNKVFRFIFFVEHTKDNTSNSCKETVEKRPVV